MWVAFALQKLLTFFSKNFQHICLSLDVNFNESLTNNFVSFEQLGPDFFFPISAQSIDCGYSLEPPPRGSSNEYPQSMFLSRNKKNNVYPCKP